MGYADTEQEISVERAEQLRDEARNAPRERYFYGGRPSWEDMMLSEAIQRWHENEANRYDGERAESPYLLPPLAQQVYRSYQEYGRPDDSAEWLTDTFITPIAAEESVVTKTRTLKVAVDGATIALLRRNDYRGNEALRLLVLKTVPATELGTVEVVSIPAPRKPVAAATEGKAKTVYVIKSAEMMYSQDRAVHATMNTQYDSQSDARQAAIDLLTANQALPDLHVEALVVRVQEDGKHNRKLVTIARPIPESGTVTVKVSTHTVKPNPKLSRYLVRFSYHH